MADEMYPLRPMTDAERAKAEAFGFAPAKPYLPDPNRFPIVAAAFARLSAEAMRAARQITGFSQAVHEGLASSPMWAEKHDVYVVDAAGWNRSTPNAFDASWGQFITEAEFTRRCRASFVVPRSELDLTPHAGAWRIGKRVGR